MLSPTLLLLVIALIFVGLSAAGKGPLWPAVLCLVLVHLVGR